jgi:hypothetical protein
LTTGDVDLHIRVPPADFVAARNVLCDLYEPLYRDDWTESAYFFDPGSDPPVELSLTTIGNIDDFHNGEAWRRIAQDPDLVERYNTLKRAYEGRSIAEYEAAKREFFHGNFNFEPSQTDEAADPSSE